MAQFPVGPKVLRYAQAAAYLGISHGRLRNLVSMGIGPDSVTYGKRDRSFSIAALDSFIEARTVRASQAAATPEPIKRKPGRPRKTTSVMHTHSLHWSAFLLALAVGYLLWTLGLLTYPFVMPLDI